ncbi:MAG: 4-(cytidine 5'-diphospho)-2-C-methyl-D-erythritol kinase [Janthinobacterium lividum]
MSSFSAYAKINLTLDVGPRRPDGYHAIESIMQTIALHDTLTVLPTPDAPGVRLDVTGEEADGVPSDESNIVHKAAVRLQKIAAARGVIPGNKSGLHISLHKRIPSQAGLGGGSSDAAAVLIVVNELFGLDLSLERLTEIGAALGADVPLFLTGGTALVEGLGEKVTALSPLEPDWPLVIVKPKVGVSTALAYGALDAAADRRDSQATQGWLNGARLLHNDFESVILPAYPEVALAYSLLLQTAKDGESFRPLLCGSGSALFLRTSTRAMAGQIAARLRSTEVGKVWVTSTMGAMNKK